MKWFIGVSFAFSIVFTHTSHAEILCPSTEYDRGYKKNLPTIDEEEAIQTNSALINGGNITCNVSFDYEKLKNNKRMRIETGTYEGVKYRIYFSDGSGLYKDCQQILLIMLVISMEPIGQHSADLMRWMIHIGVL